VGVRILATLIDEPDPFMNWQTRDYRPIYRAQGRPIAMPRVPSGEITRDAKYHYAKPVIVLSSPRTFSAAETFLVGFDQSGRGTIVGEPSAGSTGQPLSFKLPGGGSGRVCTERDTYADGRVFFGVGVQPQKVVTPTLRDFRAGKDTVLDAALAELHTATEKK
jgi:C-terminal processing protease CtpA/Prc